VSSARAALSLIDKGFARARPLRGGVSGWRERGHPVEPLLRRSVALLPNAALGTR
jgi:rhodanese-related sulfurtransferase